MAKEPLSPKNDLVFKLLFGEPSRLNLLRSFLQAVLDLPAEEYDRLVIVDPHLRGQYPEDKLGILDVKLHTTTGKIIDVEIQVESQADMWKRILFYAAKMTTEQLKSGADYESIKKVVSIIILDWHLTEKERSVYHHRFRLYDERSGYGFPDLFEIDTLELPKLPRQSDGTPLYNWLSIFTAKTREEFDMAAKTSPDIAQAVGVIMDLSEDERTRFLAESREKARRDEAARQKYAYQEGERKGERNKAMEVARAALQKNISPEDVASFTGLSLDEVKALAASLPTNH